MSIVERFLDRAQSRPGDSGEITLELMRKRHVRHILAVEVQVYPKPWSVGVFHDELAQMRAGTRHYVVAKLDGVIVGYAGLILVTDEAHVSNVAVDPQYQRHGIGRRLMLALCLEAAKRHCVSLSLEVRITNTGAQELYRSFGFAPAGIRKRYYENTVDAIVMWCHDIDTPAYAAQLAAIGAAITDYRR